MHIGDDRMGKNPRTLLVINARIEEPKNADAPLPSLPRKDYLELQRYLDADVLDIATLQQLGWTRILARLAGSALAQALLAWVWAGRYEAIFIDRETTGSVLATLCRLRRRRPRLVVVGHLLTPRPKRLLFRLLGLRHSIDCLIVHSSLQQHAATAYLGLRPDQIALLPYQTDEQFWAPHTLPLKRQICSAGLEYRDYRTLVEAARGLDVEVVIAAASHWSKHRGLEGEQMLPPNVRVVSLDYAELRTLYAESLFVVVPLRDVENQAGITTILEAMAMGKAVVVSHTRGQIDVVRDRRRLSRSDPLRPTQPEWARSLGAAEETARGHTGLYVRPGDPIELRRAIAFLLAHPEQAQMMGANGRRLVQETMSLDQFVARVAALLQRDRSATAPIETGATVSTA